jgi:long-chain acyl-CoA synthetase
MHREQVDTLFGSPYIYGSLADSLTDSAPLSNLKCCFTSGGRTPVAVIDRWRTRFGLEIRQQYGMTETGAIAIERPDSASVPSSGACVGKPVGNVELAFVGTDGAESAAQEIGELAVRSPCVMSGYLGEPELTRERFHNGYFRTGDRGYVDSDGNLHLVGRMGRVLNLGGVKVDPVEVERAIEMLEGIASCHVDSVPNGAVGEVIRARMVTRPGFQVTRREVIEQCRGQLAEYKLPRVIEFLAESPVSIAGKIQQKY